MTRRRSVLALVGLAGVVVALCLAAPLRQISGDTVPNRYGAALLACGGGYDLSRIAWIDRDHYWAQGGVSVFGPAPPTLAAVAYLGIDEIDEDSLRRRARVVAALCVALSAVLLALACLARRSLREAIAFGAVGALSFAGAATLGQGLWQQSVALPFVMAAVTAFAWRAERPRLALATPALLLVATLIRPTIAPLAIGLGIAWCLEHRSARAYAIAGGAAVLAALPFVIWNVVYLGSPLPTGQLAANAAVSSEVFVLSRAQLGYGLGGLVLSPGRGLLVFAPLALVAIGFALRGTRVTKVIAGALLAQLVVVAFFHMWWGGICFGPRFLAELVWVAIWLASLCSIRRAVVLPVAAVTFVVGVLGLFAWRAEQWETRRNPDIDQNAVWDLTDSPLTSLFRDTSDQLEAREAIDEPPRVRCVDGELR